MKPIECATARASARRSRAVAAALAFTTAVSFTTAVLAPTAGRADEGGVSFWVPGFFGSLASTPQVPGFTMANIYYHTSVTAGGNVAAAKQISAR